MGGPGSNLVCPPLIHTTGDHQSGLDNAISVSVAHPVWQRTKPNDEMDGHLGWVFRASKVTDRQTRRNDGKNCNHRPPVPDHPIRTRPCPPLPGLGVSPATAASRTT